MHKYLVTLNFNSTFTMAVDATDEGQAYDLVRNMAEDADMNQFQLGVEKESQCECIS